MSEGLVILAKSKYLLPTAVLNVMLEKKLSKIIKVNSFFHSKMSEDICICSMWDFVIKEKTKNSNTDFVEKWKNILFYWGNFSLKNNLR